MRMNTREPAVAAAAAAKAFLTLLLLLTMPFFIKLISNRGADPSLHCETELETVVRNPEAKYQGN